jgi:hypothetical protein
VPAPAPAPAPTPTNGALDMSTFSFGEVVKCKAPEGFEGLDLSKDSCGGFRVLRKAFPVRTAVRPREPECIQWSPLQDT